MLGGFRISFSCAKKLAIPGYLCYHTFIACGWGSPSKLYKPGEPLSRLERVLTFTQRSHIMAKSNEAIETTAKPVDTRKLTTTGCKEFKSRVQHTQDQYDQMCAGIKQGKTYAEIAHKHDVITANDGGKFVGYALKRGWVKFA